METNLYLAKNTLDILTKRSNDRVAFSDEQIYKERLWTHQPLNDFWRI
nr:hypothetical protein [uncultured Campylobacter sp.]